MKLGTKNLEEWFLNHKRHKFPKRIDYVDRYRTIKKVAVLAQEKIHRGTAEVERVAENPISLTGHGPKHFEKVLHNVSKLVDVKECDLTAYEVFFLLSALQIHDIGNIVGRTDHHLTAIDVFLELMPPNIVLDTIETNIFHSIAEVHTQSEAENRDTIIKLNDYYTSHNDEKIRHQLLAAILRLADELADDPERAFMFGVKNGLVVEGSRLHHIYCNSLTSTIIENKRIVVSYKFEVKTAEMEFDFKGEKIHLLDYIFIRDLKMHFERVYCQRFMTPLIFLDYIDVDITVYENDFKRKLREIRYRLLDKGYPSDKLESVTIMEICEDPNAQLKNEDGDWWNGTTLLKSIK